MYDDRNINTNTMDWITKNGQKVLTFIVVQQLRIVEA